MRDDVQVGLLIEGIERQPEAEALGKRYFFLDRFARVDFIADPLAFEVFLEIFRHQMTAVRSGVNQHIFRCRGHRAVEDDFQRLEGGIPGVERKIVAKDDEALRPSLDQLDDVGQVDQLAFLDFDDTQALGRIFVE